MTRLVDDAVAEFFLVAIVNDLAAFRRLDGGSFDFDGANRLTIRTHGKGEDCRRVSLGRDLAAENRNGCGRDALLGLSKDADVHASGLRVSFAILACTVVVGAVAAGLGIAGYGLDNGVADVDMAARFAGVEITGGDCNREPAFCERIHGRAVLDDDVVLIGEECADFPAI